MVTLPSASLEPFEAFTCYNSPYAAHADGSAIDLYPDTTRAPSPVAGEVVAIHRVRAPWQPYAREFDYVIAIDTGVGSWPLWLDDGETAGVVRVLHVDPSVSVGDTVDIGDDLGTVLRAGFFAPWVANHLHVDVRQPSADLRRAGGAVPLSLDTDVQAIPWDGTGEVVSADRTSVELEIPLDDPRSAATWVGLSTDEGSVLDGGLPHYRCGGLVDRLVGGRPSRADGRPVRLLGSRVGSADGPTVDWDEVTIIADGIPMLGLSLFCARPERYRIKLVCPGHSFTVGETIATEIAGDQ